MHEKLVSEHQRQNETGTGVCAWLRDVVASGRPAVLPTLTDGATVAIMTHCWLHRVLSSPAAYIGQLRPRNRTERLLAHLQETTPSLPGLTRLHYPMVLDIGGDGPESVALAVLTEMTAVLNQRSGQMLKWRERPIHDSELRITAPS